MTVTRQIALPDHLDGKLATWANQQGLSPEGAITQVIAQLFADPEGPKVKYRDGLPYFETPSGTPMLTTKWVNEQLADFP